MSSSDDEDEYLSADEDQQPPAPPPTPALSSSYTSEDHFGSPTTPRNNSAYNWRVPTKTKQTTESSEQDSKKDQTRIALDRLSEKLSHSDKNLFEKITEDIKRVSIRTESETANSEGTSSLASGKPIIEDLGSTLGGWSWNSASKLLSSATQMTSQVGSVLNSVSQHLQTSNETQNPTVSQETECQGGLSSQAGEKAESSNRNASMSVNEAVSNDAFVDLTLNAMESLGKKAFNVMTERDESGSLQIKGLGRPWEHLLNIKKPETHAQNEEPTSFTELEEGDSISYPSVPKRVDETTSLKNRKRRYNKEDDLD